MGGSEEYSSIPVVLGTAGFVEDVKKIREIASLLLRVED